MKKEVKLKPITHENKQQNLKSLAVSNLGELTAP